MDFKHAQGPKPIHIHLNLHLCRKTTEESKKKKKTYMLLEKSFLSTNKITSFAMQRNNHIAYIFNDSKPNHRIMKHVFSFKNYKAAKRKNMPQLHIFPCQLPNLGIFLTQTRFIRLLNDDYPISIVMEQAKPKNNMNHGT